MSLPDARPSPSTLRVAVIGAGAVAETFHLPTLAQAVDVSPAGLAELDDARRSRVAARFGIQKAVRDYRDLIGSIDAAIVAVPHHLHAPVAIELLENGIHVLVEKPMAQSAAECDAMLAAANATGAVLAVGLMRRFMPSVAFTTNALASGMVGDVERFEVSEGRVYEWRSASSYPFERQSGGVLADIGAHVLDLVVTWFGDCSTLRYFDDARGGVEADCRIEMVMKSGVAGTVELSRSRALSNLCRIEGSRGMLEIGTKSSHVRWTSPISAFGFRWEAPAELSAGAEKFKLQLDDFIAAVRHHRAPAVPGTEGRRSVDLIERCYRNRQSLDRSWDRIDCPTDEEPR